MTDDLAADKAVMDDVFSAGRDRGAKSAAPEVEAKEAPPPQQQEHVADKDATTADTKPKGYRDPDSGRFVPLDELKSEREKRQEAQKAREDEARLRQQAEENARRYEQQLRDMERRIQAQQNPPPPPPDPMLEPEAAFSHMQQQFESKLLNQTLNFSERMARRHHGNETVDAAFKAAVEAGVTQAFLRTADPYDDLVSWHKRKIAMDRVGSDPDAYEKRVREEERARVLEELRTGKAQLTPGSSQPQTPQSRFPTGLADATSAGPGGAVPVTDAAVMGSIFSAERKRK